VKIKIEYNGEYPNLCRGKLYVTIRGKRWKFPVGCLSSGGGVWFGKNWSVHVDYGPWSVWEWAWPAGFPEKHKQAVLDEINMEIPQGCCGGCV